MKYHLAFLVLTAASAIPLLLISADAFRSLDPVAIISSAWVVLLAAVIGIAGVRIVQSGRTPPPSIPWLRAFIIFGIHSLVVAIWLGWALQRESQGSPGGWVATMLLHYTIEVPSSGACWIAERLWRHASGHGFRTEWLYLVYFVIGGAFYALLPSLFRTTTKPNATNVA